MRMADNKKYYYMRLKENFFDSNELTVLESMQDGYLYSNILLKLYLRSLKDNGKLMFNDRIPYNAQMIATITRHQVGTVEKALRIFQEMGLIEILDNGAIYMLDIQQFIGKSSTEADRIRTYRMEIENQKMLDGQMSVQMYDKCTPEIEIEKDIELEIDKEIEEEKKKKETFVSLIDDYTYNPLLASALKDFVEMRKKKKGYTTRALKLNLRTLSSLATDDDTKIAIVEQSIEGTWNSFYELKVKPKSKEIVPEWTKQEQETTKDSHLEELMKRYLMFKMANNQTEMDKIKGLYFDLTLKDIETDIKER